MPPTPPPSSSPIPVANLAPNTTTVPNLENYLGQTVDTFCGKYGTVGDSFNHCAHFVCHVLSLKIPGAALCSNVGGTKYSYEDRSKGFCIRVNQVFNNCNNRAYWDDKNLPSGTCLIIATIPANIETTSPLSIGQMSHKHIGFYTGGQVYHYSNTRDKVIKQAVSEFKNHYGGKTVLLRCDLP